MTDLDQRLLLSGLAEAIGLHEWGRLGDYLHPDAVIEYPQSGERFTGLTNIRAQFENYPALVPGGTQLHEVIDTTTYALTPSYTVIAVEGTGSRGTAVLRVHYPDGSTWWVVNIYELRDGLIGRSRNFFAPEFEPPDWRKPFADPRSD